jgi:hypothetical protein
MYLATLDPEGLGHEDSVNAAPAALRANAKAVRTRRQEARLVASFSDAEASLVTSVSDMMPPLVPRTGTKRIRNYDIRSRYGGCNIGCLRKHQG